MSTLTGASFGGSVMVNMAVKGTPSKIEGKPSRERKNGPEPRGDFFLL